MGGLQRRRRAGGRGAAGRRGVSRTRGGNRHVQDRRFPGRVHAVRRGRREEFFEELKNEPPPDLVFTHRSTIDIRTIACLAELTWNTFRDHVILEYEIPKYEGDLGQPERVRSAQRRVARRKVELLMTMFGTQRSKRWFTEDLVRGRHAAARRGGGPAQRTCGGVSLPQTVAGPHERQRERSSCHESSSHRPPRIHRHADGATAPRRRPRRRRARQRLLRRRRRSRTESRPCRTSGRHPRRPRPDLAGFDAVIHLAALSNDPLGNLESGSHLRHQPSRHRSPGGGRQGGRSPPVPVFVVLQQLWRGGRRHRC